MTLELTKYLPYLLNRAGSRIATAFTRELKPHGIGLNRWRILAALHQVGTSRMGELAELTSIEGSTLSRAVGRLSSAKLVRRARSAEDQRGVSVRLTTEGRNLTETLIPLALRYERVALGALSPAEAALLKRLLARVYDNMAGLDDGEAGPEAVDAA